jgi:hypothetical protein
VALREDFFLEKLIFAKLAKKFLASCRPRKNMIAFKRTSHRIYNEEV